MKNKLLKSKKTSAAYIVLFAILAIYTVSLAIPLLWTLLTSFKDYKVYSLAYVRKDIAELIGLGNLSFDNYKIAFETFTITITETGKTVNILGMFGNSILYALGCGIVATLTPCIVSYLCARYKYRFGNIVYTVVLVAMALPIVGSLPSEITMVKALHLYDNVLGMYVLKANFLGLYFLVFYAQFKSIAYDYTEAAEIDGASDLRIMLTVIFPLAIGTISTVFILNFIAFWNDYQTPMIYWPSYPVAAYGMYDLQHSTFGARSQMPVKLAGIMLMALPILIVFAIFNRKVMTNVSVGGIKG